MTPASGVTLGPEPYWSMPPETVATRLGTTLAGLTTDDAARRLEAVGPNQTRDHARLSRLRTLLDQLRSPLLLLLLFAAVASAASGEMIDASIVAVIVTVSVAVGYSREYHAQAAAAALRARIRVQCTVVRGGAPRRIPVEEVVPGDIVQLTSGCLVPADAVVVDAADFYVSEAILTGESLPATKGPGPVPDATPLARRTNCVHLGTNVRSGRATCLVVHTGGQTALGAIADRLILRPPETEFDRGLRRFGYLLTVAMLSMVLVVFALHMLLGHHVVDTLMFAVALAVGLSPELLPAILSVNLARGAQAMATRGVLVRRLNAIENLGSMDVLCTDKTGTLTEGVVRVQGSYDASGATAPRPLALAACNAAFETGLANPLDEALLEACPDAAGGAEKRGEVPFDFARKRMSVLVRNADGTMLITKGAISRVLDVCSHTADGARLDDGRRAALDGLHEAWSRQGIRVLGVAWRAMDTAVCTRESETGMTFAGFVTFLDRPKEGVTAALASLAALGVAVKLISGDNRFVAAHVAGLVGMPNTTMLTGPELDALNNDALPAAAERTGIFAEVDPHQKERIIVALKQLGHVVGFLGDGVNDAPAMHAADTSLSVEHAADVAREVADFVLLERGLDVIRAGIEQGRRTFANTLKYILTTTSANLGNMLSMAAISVVLPFLPLTAGQILLNNFLSDVPAVGLADDSVDEEMLAQPERWDMRAIGRFMLEFGALSSVFDMLTFGVLLIGFAAPVATFRTAWFTESLLTELAVALVVRTRRPFWRSRPGRVLLVSTVALALFALALPALPYAGVFGFVPLPPALTAAVVGITLSYLAATELLKRWFYRRQVA